MAEEGALAERALTTAWDAAFSPPGYYAASPSASPSYQEADAVAQQMPALPPAEGYKKYDTAPWEGQNLFLHLDHADALACSYGPSR